MGLNLKKILDTVTDILPMGTTVKSVLRGASSLLLKKAAKKVGIDIEPVLAEAEKIVEVDPEIQMALIQEEKDRRAHELEFYGKFAELDTGSQKLRARIRPLLSLGLIGTFIIMCFAFLFQQLFPKIFGLEFMIIFPPELVSISKVVIGFWFGSRGIEKVAGIIKNGN